MKVPAGKSRRDAEPIDHQITRLRERLIGLEMSKQLVKGPHDIEVFCAALDELSGHTVAGILRGLDITGASGTRDAVTVAVCERTRWTASEIAALPELFGLGDEREDGDVAGMLQQERVQEFEAAMAQLVDLGAARLSVVFDDVEIRPSNARQAIAGAVEILCDLSRKRAWALVARPESFELSHVTPTIEADADAAVALVQRAYAEQGSDPLAGPVVPVVLVEVSGAEPTLYVLSKRLRDDDR